MYLLTAIISIALSAIITTIILSAKLKAAVHEEATVFTQTIFRIDEDYMKRYKGVDRRLKQLEPVTSADKMDEVFKQINQAVGKKMAGK